MKLHFPEQFNHRHIPVKSTNQLFEAQLTTSQRAADWVAALIGSWKFIITQSILLGIWVLLNAAAWIHHWDPYPFVLMNLMLSIQAAYAAPIIMMSQNRQAARDHMEAHNDYVINMLYFLFKGDSSLFTIPSALRANRAKSFLNSFSVSGYLLIPQKIDRISWICTFTPPIYLNASKSLPDNSLLPRNSLLVCCRYFFNSFLYTLDKR